MPLPPTKPIRTPGHFFGELNDLPQEAAEARGAAMLPPIRRTKSETGSPKNVVDATLGMFTFERAPFDEAQIARKFGRAPHTPMGGERGEERGGSRDIVAETARRAEKLASNDESSMYLNAGRGDKHALVRGDARSLWGAGARPGSSLKKKERLRESPNDDDESPRTTVHFEAIPPRKVRSLRAGSSKKVEVSADEIVEIRARQEASGPRPDTRRSKRGARCDDDGIAPVIDAHMFEGEGSEVLSQWGFAASSSKDSSFDGLSSYCASLTPIKA